MRAILINTQERAVSTDINRLQAFAMRDLADLLRYEFLGNVAGPSAPGASSYPTTVGIPLKAEILGGLLVKPQGNTFDILVDPGYLLAIAPDSGADSSVAQVVDDLGVPLVGSLSIGTNSSGNIRIDVIECQINPVPDVTTDNRDVFDETTGLFSAQAVTKEVGDRLAYRVRAGTPGAGFPGSVSGWLPLCVAKVPSGASSNNNVTFWDVRPLASDRVNTLRAWPSGTHPELLALDAIGIRSSSSSFQISGQWRAKIGGREVHGYFNGGLGTYTSGYLDVAVAANQDTGTIAESLSGAVYVYACTPFGLPRWAVYSPGTTGRLPENCGIMVASYTLAGDGLAEPSTNIALPASCGLGGVATNLESACIAVCEHTNSNTWNNWTARDKHVRLLSEGHAVASGAYSAVVSQNFEFNVNDTIWPPCAKSVDVSCDTSSITLPATTVVQGTTDLCVVNGLTGGDVSRSEHVPFTLANTAGAGAPVILHMEATVHQPWALGAVAPRLVHWQAVDLGSATIAGTPPTLTAVTATLRVRGFQL